MRKVLRSGTQQMEVLQWHECGPDDTPMEFGDIFFALSFIRRFMLDPFNMMILRDTLAESLPLSAVSVPGLTDHEVLQQFAWQVVHGYVKLVAKVEEMPHITFPGEAPEDTSEAEESEAEAAETTTEASADSATPDAAAATTGPEVTTNWIEFRIVDDETDQPVADVRITIRLPDGASQELATDANGIVRIDDVPSGTFDIEEIVDPYASEIVQVG